MERVMYDFGTTLRKFNNTSQLSTFLSAAGIECESFINWARMAGILTTEFVPGDDVFDITNTRIEWREYRASESSATERETTFARDFFLRFITTGYPSFEWFLNKFEDRTTLQFFYNKQDKMWGGELMTFDKVFSVLSGRWHLVADDGTGKLIWDVSRNDTIMEILRLKTEVLTCERAAIRLKQISEWGPALFGEHPVGEEDVKAAAKCPELKARLKRAINEVFS
jgi:hypothetical protein